MKVYVILEEDKDYGPYVVDIFLRREDAEVALAIVSLSARSCWIEEHDVKGGEEIPEDEGN